MTTGGAGAGTLTTVPLTAGTSSSRISQNVFVNINATHSPTASVMVELLDAAGSVLKTSHKMAGVDATRLLVPWSSETIATTQDQALAWARGNVRLRFTLEDGAHLYSFWVSDEASCGASRGPVAAGGGAFTSGWDTHGACV
jgi:hypothetical protein